MRHCDVYDFGKVIVRLLLTYCRLAACIQVLFDVAEPGWSCRVYIRHVHNELADCTDHNGRHRRSLLLRALSQAGFVTTAAVFGATVFTAVF